MDLRPLASVGLSLAGVLALGITLAWLQRRGWVDTRKERVRRGAGHAMLGLREFVDPSVEYVIQAENAEQRAVDDLDSSGVDTEEILADLSTSLGRDPVDHEEVRRHLASARRAGLDWREAYAGAVRGELTARPFRAPSLPPIWKVAPRE
jgi:hypothetical protein